MSKSTKISAPAGMAGLWVAPWSSDEIYAVAADWAQASAPVYTYGEDGWDLDSCGRQVADFRHSPESALRAQIVAAIEAGGETTGEVECECAGDDADCPECDGSGEIDGDVTDDEIDDMLADAEDLVPADLADMIKVLESHGTLFTGNCAADEAQDWLDAGFTADQADPWCEAGFWNAAIAAECRDAGMTPEHATAVAEVLTDGLDEPADHYTDGDPVYSACNCDTAVSILIDAARDGGLIE